MKKSVLVVAMLAMVLVSVVPALAQLLDEGSIIAPDTGSAIVPADLDGNYLLPLDGDRQVYYKYGVLGEPVTEFCLANGITPALFFDPYEGSLVNVYPPDTAGLQYETP